MSAEEWQAKVDAILKEYRTQDVANPTLSRDDAIKRLKAAGISIGEAVKYLSTKGSRP